MAKATFKYRNTGQEITITDAKRIAQWKKNPKWTLLDEVKATRTRKPVEPKIETEE